MYHLIAISVDMEGQPEAGTVAGGIKRATGAWAGVLKDEINFYHLQVNLVKFGQEGPIIEGDAWRLAIGADGAILQEDQVRAALRNLVMRYAVKFGLDNKRPYRVVGIARSACVAALALFSFAKWVHDEVERLQPLKMDLFLLQPQAEPGDIHSSEVALRLFEINQNGWFRHTYLMPWDDDTCREQSQDAIVTFCRVSMRIEADSKPNNPMLVETLSSRQLLPPAKYIRESILRLMTRSFIKMLVEDGNPIGKIDPSACAGQDGHTAAIRDRLCTLYERHRPASITRLHGVMPLRDPVARSSQADAFSIHQLYDERALSELKRMTEVDGQAILDDFEGAQTAVTERMIRMVVAECARRSIRIGDMAVLNNPILSLGRFLPPPARQPDKERWSGNPLLRGRVAIAKQRYELLMNLYQPARDESEKKCREAMTCVIERGEVSCQVFLSEVKERLLSRLEQMASAESWINDERYYIGMVEEAYGFWWSENREMALSFDAFYKMLDESLSLGDAQITADNLYDRVAERLNQRVDEVMRPIRNRVERFFEELALRSELLRRAGAPSDLFEKLSRDLTQRASHRLLLLVQAGPVDIAPVRSVYIVPAGEAVSEFCRLAEKITQRTLVLRDDSEPGVVLMIEYGGNVLDRLPFAGLEGKILKFGGVSS